jgi:hypothetical protein
MLALIPLLLSALAGSTPAQEDQGLTLHEPTTGATLTLPENWSLATGEEGLMSFNDDKRGFVLLVGAEQNFESMRTDVKALILTRLDDVVVAKTTIQGVNERGALEQLVVATGTGMSRMDGEKVDFMGLVLKSGDTGVLALGAWKDEANKELVTKVLESLHVKESAGKGGLEITNAKTGASIKIPMGWDVVRTRKGLLTTDPSGKAMAILMNWQGNFDESLTKIRASLSTWVFKEIEIGEFAMIEATYDKSLGRVIAASGKAIDRMDEKPVEFTALRIQNVDADHGAVLFGAWKDEKSAKQVAELMASIKIKMPKKKK